MKNRRRWKVVVVKKIRSGRRNQTSGFLSALPSAAKAAFLGSAQAVRLEVAPFPDDLFAGYPTFRFLREKWGFIHRFSIFKSRHELLKLAPVESS